MKEAWSNISPLFVDDLFFSCELDVRGIQQIRTQMYSQPKYLNDYYGREKYNVMIIFCKVVQQDLYFPAWSFKIDSYVGNPQGQPATALPKSSVYLGVWRVRIGNVAMAKGKSLADSLQLRNESCKAIQ